MRRILVADDEANMRWVLERALTKAGYEVETVEDGQLAIDRALAERPDLVLVDLKMPKIDGLSVLHTLPTLIKHHLVQQSRMNMSRRNGSIT